MFVLAAKTHVFKSVLADFILNEAILDDLFA